MRKTRRQLTIFLDIDGVLNTTSDWRKGFYIRQGCVDALRALCGHFRHVDIVFSSTWRQSLNGAITGTILDQLLEDGNVAFAGATPQSNKTRQEEIEYYIRKHGIKDYLVIDDDKSLFPNPERLNLLWTDANTGLTTKQYHSV